MSLKLFSVYEKLAVVEALIRDLNDGLESSDTRRIGVLKAIASDLRGRIETAPSAVLVDLEGRITAALRSKTVIGYSAHTLRGVGEGLIVRWPTVRQALEKFGEDV